MEKNNLPASFIEKIREILSEDDFKSCMEAFKIQKRNPIFRVNLIKANKDTVIKDLEKNNIKIVEKPWLEEGFIVIDSDEKWLQKTDSYKKWWIYLQNISSQIPVLFFSEWENLEILDACASPWWKTSQLSQKFPTSNITALDLTTVRIDKLKYNMELLWCKNVDIIKKNVVDYSIESTKRFDRILLDVPCSWEWRFNENREKSYAHYSPLFVKKSYKKQFEIAKNSLKLLKQWWEMIYSTCSLWYEENEAVVHAILSNFKDMEIVEINCDFDNSRSAILKAWDKVFNKNTSKAIRFLPNNDFQWFFVAKFKKKTI